MRIDANSARTNNFDLLRFLLAVAVIFSHSYPLGQGNEKNEPFLTWFGSSLGELAVAGFFSISGYLIVASWQRKSSLLDYCRKRVLRIYPGWLVVNLLAIVVMLGMSAVSLTEVAAWLPRAIILERFNSSAAFPTNVYPGVINGSLWTIPYEFMCYILVAALGLTGLLHARWRLVTVTGVIIMLGSLQMVYPWSPSGRLTSLLTLSPYFLVGACFYEFREKIEFHKWWFGVSLLVCLVSGLIPVLKPVLLPLGMSYAIFYAAFQRRLRFHSFGKYGDFSYGIYLYAFPIQQLIVHAAGGSMNPILLFIAATPLSILAGVASWYGVERWCLPQRRRREIPHLEEPKPAVEVT